MDTSSTPPPPPTAVETVRFSFESLSQAPGTPWQRKGKGEARLEWSGSILQVEESGVWWDKRLDPGKRHVFRKVFQLEQTGLDTLRYLKPTPDGDLQELLVLIPREDGGWHSPVPHHCIDDFYRAELHLDPSDTLHITWWSEGPEKHYTLHTRYQNAHLSRAWLDS